MIYVAEKLEYFFLVSIIGGNKNFAKVARGSVSHPRMRFHRRHFIKDSVNTAVQGLYHMYDTRHFSPRNACVSRYSTLCDERGVSRQNLTALSYARFAQNSMRGRLNGTTGRQSHAMLSLGLRTIRAGHSKFAIHRDETGLLRRCDWRRPSTVRFSAAELASNPSLILGIF
jgi:hypothetical protein